MDKLQEIKHWAMVSNQGVHPSVSLAKSEFDWLIEEVERLRVIEQAYEGMKKAL